MSYQWGVNESDEKELIRVSIVNDKGLLVFDSIIQPSKRIKYAPLFDASFGIPLKYLSEMLNTIFEQRRINGGLPYGQDIGRCTRNDVQT